MSGGVRFFGSLAVAAGALLALLSVVGFALSAQPVFLVYALVFATGASVVWKGVAHGER